MALHARSSRSGFFSALFASATIAFARAKPSFSSRAESASARSSSLAKSGYAITVSGHPLRHISLVPTIHARPSSHLRPFSVIEYIGIAGFSLGEMVISPCSDNNVAICATLHCPPRPCAESAQSSVYQFQFFSEAESDFSMAILMSSLIVARPVDRSFRKPIPSYPAAGLASIPVLLWLRLD